MDFVPTTPSELAQPVAETLVLSGELDEFEDASAYEQAKLVELERLAEQLALLDQLYFVKSHRSIILPKHFERDDPHVKFWNFAQGLDFRGRFITYGTVRIGKILGGTSVRALCLAFQDATLLPYMDRVDDSRLVYTPALAISDMDLVDEP